MKVHHEVTVIHPETKSVSVKNLETGMEFEEQHTKRNLREEIDKRQHSWKKQSRC